MKCLIKPLDACIELDGLALGICVRVALWGILITVIGHVWGAFNRLFFGEVEPQLFANILVVVLVTAVVELLIRYRKWKIAYQIAIWKAAKE